MKFIQHHKQFISFFKAMCDANRHRILDLLRKNEEMNASDIVAHIKLSQPTVSHHLKIMVDSGVLETRKQGKETFYKINSLLISDCCSGFANHFCRKQEK